jgi:hypothetical protein
MTAQTKVFIELTDIIGLRLQCKECGSSLLIGIANTDGTLNELLSPHNYLLAKCPTCESQWTNVDRAAAAHGTASFDSHVKQLFRALAEVRKIESALGCALTLEIVPEKKAAS